MESGKEGGSVGGMLRMGGSLWNERVDIHVASPSKPNEKK